MSVNRADILGHLGRDPENNKGAVKFSIATNERWKDKDGNKHEGTTWHNCVCFGKRGETIMQYFKKGDQIFISGRISNSTYQKKDCNCKGYSSEIIVKEFSFVGGAVAEPARQNHPVGSEVPPGVTPVGQDDQDPLPF